MKQISRKKNLNKILCDYFGRKYCQLVGSGTTALLVSLLAQNFPRNSEVIVPNFTCFIVPMAVKLADLKPVFVEIQKKDYNIATSKIEEKITKRTRAIIGVHTFGRSFEVDKIKNICSQNNIMLFEDFCQSVGGDYSNKLHGNFGDISFCSFAIGKTVGAQGGGAIFTDNLEIYQTIKSYSRNLKPINWSSIVMRLLCDDLKNPPNFLTSKVINILSIIVSRKIETYHFAPVIIKLFYLFDKNIFLHSMTMANLRDIVNSLGKIQSAKDKTVTDAKRYKSLLDKRYFRFPDYDLDTGIVWRYSILVNGVDRKILFKEIDRRGYKLYRDLGVGTSYFPPLNRCWSSSLEEKMSVSESVSSRIINLPVGPRITSQKIDKLCKILNSAVNDVQKK